MKKLRLLSLLLLVSVLLTGCLSPKVSLTIEPNPIKVTVGQEEITGLAVWIKTSGFSIRYQLDKVVGILTDADGEIIATMQKDLDQSTPVVPGIKKKVELPAISLAEVAELDEALYEEHLKGQEWELEITLIGTKDSNAKAKVLFQ